MDQSLQCLRSEVVAMATEALAVTGFRTSRNDSRLLTQEKLCGIVGGARDWESGTWTPLALTVTHCVTLGESFPFPEPQLPCLEK